MNMDEIRKQVKDLSGEELGEILELAGRDVDLKEARWALHCLIIYANEYGQPKGQDLSEPDQVCYLF